MDTPYSLVTFDEVPSTQDLARDRAEPGLASVVVAHRQTSGRGRGGSGWETAPRAVAVSVGQVVEWDPAHWSVVPLVAGVAARRSLGGRVALKWPNDVMVDEEKVAGILVEARDGVVVAGLGLNLFWPDPMPGARGLLETDPGPEEGPRLATAWAEELLALLAGDPHDWPRTEYRNACVTLGRDVTWEPDGRGRATDIGPDGSLEVVTSAGNRESLSSGEVRHVRSA